MPKNTTRVSIESTPGKRWFVRIEPPHEDYPMRSFDKLAQAKNYKWFVDLRITSDDAEQQQTNPIS